MKNLSLSVSLRTIALTLVLSLLASCSDGPEVVAVKRDPLPLPTSALSVTGQPGRFGGTLAVALPTGISTFNPYYQLELPEREVLHQLYARLVGFDPVAGEVLPQGGLAQSFEATGQKVTIRLRNGLNFSNGLPIRADDVVYSFAVALDSDVKSPLVDMLTVSGKRPEVKKIDPLTVELEFAGPYPAIGYVLSQMPVISAGSDPQATMDRGRFEEALNINTKPAEIVCSGPYCVESYDKEKGIKLRYNPHYWKVDSQGQRLPYIDFMEFKFGQSDDKIIEGLTEQTINVATSIDPAKFVELGDGGGKFLAQDLGVGYGTWQLIGNMSADRAADKVKVGWILNYKFRDFLTRIVDRQAIAKDAFAGKAVPVYGPVTPGNRVWYEDGVKKYSADVGAATAVLGAEFKIVERDGKAQFLDLVDRKVKFKLYYPKEPAAERMQKNIVESLEKVGIAVEAEAFESGTILRQFLLPGKFDLVLYRSGGYGPDPISYMPIFMASGSQHYFLYTSEGNASILPWEAQVSRLMRSQQDKVLDAERLPDFSKAQKLWAENNPVTYIVADHILVAADKRLGNYQPVNVHPYVTWNAESLFFKQP